jgi:hypothetical protein
MSKDIYSKVIEELRDEFIGNPSGGAKLNPIVNNILNTLINNKAEEYKLFNLKPSELELKKEIRTLLNKVADTLIKNKEYKNESYKKSYDKLKALVDKGETFEDVFTEVYEGEYYLSNIFIRLIEDKEGVVITSSKQLQELSGITEIYGYWDEDKGETVQYKDKTISTKKEAQEEAKKQIEATFIEGMYNRYSTTIEDMLQAGAKYKDILLLNPKDFNLPEKWSGTLAKNKEEVIIWAINHTYLIDEPAGLMLFPSLRRIAKDLEAPYSVVMDSYNLTNRRGGTKVDHKVIKAQKEDIILTALPKLMDKIGDKYYQYFIKDEDKKDYRELSPQELKDFKEDVLQELKHEFKTTLSLLIINNLKKEDKIELDELQSLIALDIVRYFSTELIELKTLFHGATRN